MKPPLVWIVVADGAHSRIFETSAGFQQLQAVQDETSRTAATHELGRERPARVQQSAGPARHGISPREDLHEREEWRRAEALARRLDAAAQQARFERLVIIAPPKFLGELRSGLSKRVAALVTASFDRDLAGHPASALLSEIRALLKLD